jgi:SAM-dependent methyltransferase
MTADSTIYWNEFYSSKATAQLDLPSQFAVFVLNEIDRNSLIIDVGCGTGRDSLFFASRGARVIGVDASHSAVELCRSKSTSLGFSNTEFICSDITDSGLRQRLNVPKGAPVCLYARFFLHAIPEEGEDAFFRLAAEISPEVQVAIEFRTDRDAHQAKTTDHHFRRFILPVSTVARGAVHGFSPIYFVEGFGFAKHKHDDAHVARVIFAKTRK